MIKKHLSLIEILVVLAVLVMLFAWLIPFLNHAMESSLTTKCAHQLRQVGMASGTYNEDHLDHYPGASGPASEGPPFEYPYAHRWWSDWMWDIWLYVGASKPLYHMDENEPIYEKQPTHINLVCPSRIPGHAYVRLRNTDYGINMFITTTYSPLLSTPQIFKRATKVLHPDGTHLFSDTSDWSMDYMNSRTNTGYFRLPSLRHQEGNNNLFVDGHVKWLSWMQTVDSGSLPGAYYGGGYNHPLYDHTQKFPRDN